MPENVSDINARRRQEDQAALAAQKNQGGGTTQVWGNPADVTQDREGKISQTIGNQDTGVRVGGYVQPGNPAANAGNQSTGSPFAYGGPSEGQMGQMAKLNAVQRTQGQAQGSAAPTAAAPMGYPVSSMAQGGLSSMVGGNAATMASATPNFRGAPPTGASPSGVNVPGNPYQPTGAPTTPYYSPSDQYTNAPASASPAVQVAPTAGSINKAAFYMNERGDQDRANMMAYEQAAGNRQAATVDRTNVGTSANIQGQRTNAFDSQAAQANAVRLMGAQEAAGAQMNPTTTSNNVGLNPAAQAGNVAISREDMDFRNQQQALAAQTMAQAAGQGPSVATQQMNQGLAANLAAQQAAAASQRGFGNTAATSRQLAQQQAGANLGTAQQAAQLRMQEQQQGIQNAAGLTTGARAQDIGLGTAQAGLTQQTGLSNQAASNQFALQNQASQLQNQQFNAGMINTQNLNQAQLAQQNQQFNVGNQNQFALQNAAYQQQANMGNTSNQQQMALANQQAQLQAAGTNQASQNQFTLAQAQLNNQTNLANLQSYYQQQGMNDAQVQAMLASRTNLDLQRQQAQMGYETLQTNAGLGQATINAQLQNAAANREVQQQGNYIAGGATLVGAGITALSDKREKKDISNLTNKQINKFLYSLGEI